MKIASKLIALTAALAMLTSCGEKPSVNPEPQDSQRDIYYTVAEGSGLTGLSGNTIHLANEAEWDALLNQFCDYAVAGEQVTFCNLTPSTSVNGKGNRKGLGSNTPTTITTSNRDELKSWMKEMEKAGKTVNVSYDEGTGTWSGHAYTNISNHGSTVQSYEGTLAFVPVPVLDNPPLDGLSMALVTGNGNTYIVTIHGMIIGFDSEENQELLRILQGSPATLVGIEGEHTDLNGNTFLSIDLEVPDDGVIEF